jgi:hypothetical protein
MVRPGSCSAPRQFELYYDILVTLRSDPRVLPLNSV